MNRRRVGMTLGDCPRCGGTGNDSGILLGWCNRCHGSGRDPGLLALVRRRVVYLWLDVQERPLVWLPVGLIFVAIAIMLSSPWRLP